MLSCTPQCLLMPSIGDEHAFPLDSSAGQDEVGNGLFEFWQSGPGQRRCCYAWGAGPHTAHLSNLQLLWTICLIDYDNNRSAGSSAVIKAHGPQFFRDALVPPGQSFCAVEHQQDQVGTFGGSTTALHAYLLDRVICWRNASRVDEV